MMEESGFSPAKIAVLAVIIAAFVVGGYFATRSDSSDAPAKVAAAPAAPADAAASTTADVSPAAATGAAPDTASSTPADQANPAPAQVSPPPSTAMAAAQPAVGPSASAAPVAASNEIAQSAPEEAAPPPKKSHRVESDESASPKHEHAKSPPPASAVLTPWWNQNAGGFHVVAVGPASEKPGIVVVFSTDLKDPAAAGQQLHLKRNGQPVSGTWQKGANNRVLALTDLTPGQYQLAIDGAIADTSSQTLGATKAGPVFVTQ